MIEKELLSKKQNLEVTLAKYVDLIENEVEHAETDFAFKETSQEIKERLKQLRQSNRLLKIGVVGRVKAGKSSLLNSLFFEGENVLPKAATPMTAALTVLEYGDAFSADLNFYSDKDLTDIKEKHNSVRNRLIKNSQRYLEDSKARSRNKGKELNISELKEKADKKALRELKAEDSFASYEHYQKIQNATVNISDLRNKPQITANSYQDLMLQLEEYVGAKGKYMPFTKDVSLSLADERLNGIQVIDTPGINDPVVSREQRTQELLKDCQVTLIVSPSGQFLSDQDLSLMDRISDKEGINELYLIGSKIDSQLREKDYSFDEILELRLKSLSSRVKDALQNTISSTNNDSLNSLISEAKERVLFNSSISHSIKRCLVTGEAMDETEDHVWNNFLQKHFPESFNSNEQENSFKNLDKLANLEAIEQNIYSVQKRKEDILEKQVAEYSFVKGKSLTKIIETLIEKGEEKKEEVNNNDVGSLRDKLDKVNDLKEELSLDFEELYSDFKGDLKREIPRNLKTTIKQKYRESFDNVDGASSSKPESYTVEKSGVGNWLARTLWGGGKEQRPCQVTTVNTSAIDKYINDFIYEIEDVIEYSYYTDLKSLITHLSNELISQVQKNSNSPLTTKDLRKITRVIKQKIYDFSELQFILPNKSKRTNSADKIISNLNTKSNFIDFFKSFSGGALKDRGEIEGESAKEYITQSQEFLAELQKEANKCITKHFNKLLKELDTLDIIEISLGKISKDINQLTEQIENKEMTLDRLDLLLSELKAI